MLLGEDTLLSKEISADIKFIYTGLGAIVIGVLLLITWKLSFLFPTFPGDEILMAMCVAFFYGGLFVFLGLANYIHCARHGSRSYGGTTFYCPHCQRQLSLENIPAAKNALFGCPYCKHTINTKINWLTPKIKARG
jgi:hypothetical protein